MKRRARQICSREEKKAFISTKPSVEDDLASAATLQHNASVTTETAAVQHVTADIASLPTTTTTSTDDEECGNQELHWKKKLKVLPQGLECMINTELRRGTPLFVYALSEDLVRDSLLAPLTNAKEWGRHLPQSYLQVFSKVPTPSFWQGLAHQDVDVLEAFFQEYPHFNDELGELITTEEGRSLFVTFYIRFCNTLFCVQKIYFKWTSKYGFSVYCNTDVPKGTVLPYSWCWGDRVLVSPAEKLIFESLNMETKKCLVQVCRDVYRSQEFYESYMALFTKYGYDEDTFIPKRTDLDFAVFGPMAFINYSCGLHANLILHASPEKHSGKFSVGISFPMSRPLVDTDLEQCSTPVYKDLKINDRLLASCKMSLGCTSPLHGELEL